MCLEIFQKRGGYRFLWSLLLGAAEGTWIGRRKSRASQLHGQTCMHGWQAGRQAGRCCTASSPLSSLLSFFLSSLSSSSSSSSYSSFFLELQAQPFFRLFFSAEYVADPSKCGFPLRYLSRLTPPILRKVRRLLGLEIRLNYHGLRYLREDTRIRYHNTQL